MSAGYGVLGISFVVAGPVTNAIGARWAYALAAAGIGVASGLARKLVRGDEAQPQPAAA
jgi:hypothetical protein